MSDRATQADILQHILARLRVKIPEFTDANSFLCDQIIPAQWPDGLLCCTLSVPEGRFPEPFSAGGGVSTLCENMTVDVTLFVRCSLDGPPDCDAALVGPEGLWSRWKPDVLRALLLEGSSSSSVDCWMPVDEDGVGLLRNQIAALRSSAVRPDATGQWSGITISFSVDFDWRL